MIIGHRKQLITPWFNNHGVINNKRQKQRFKYTFCFLLIAILNFCFSVKAQYFYENRQLNGISNNTIRFVYIDFDGLAWISTDEGLFQFDGYNSKTFSTIREYRSNIPKGAVQRILELDNDHLLIPYVPYGLAIYDKTYDFFPRLSIDSSLKGLESKIIGKIELNDNETIIAMANAVFLFDRINYSITTILSPSERVQVEKISFRNNHELIVKTERGEHIVSKFKGNVNSMTRNFYINGISNSNHSYNFFSSQAYDFFDKGNKKHYPKTKFYIAGIDSYFVIHGESGIGFVSNKRSYFEFPSIIKNGLPSLFFRTFTQDEDGNWWMGTVNHGVYKIDSLNKIVNYEMNSQVSDSPINNHIRKILALNDDVWSISEFGGLHKYQPKTDSWQDYSKGFPTLELFGGFEDHQKRLWINHKKGVSIRQQRKFKHITKFPNGKDLGPIRAIAQDQQNIMWFGSHKQGLYRFDEKNNDWKIFSHDDKDPNSVGHDYIFGLLSDTKNRLWIGSWGGGLDYFDQNNNKFIHYTTEDGLPSNVVYGILEDKSGYLWFSTMKGLVQFKPCEDKQGNITKSCAPFLRVFDKRDGLIIDEFDSESYYKAPNGDMYFGGSGGFIRFNPETDIKFNDIPPKNVIFTELTVNGKRQHPSTSPYIDKAINYVDAVKLNYDDILIKFDFASLDYVLPEKNQFKYRLNGGDWVELGTQHTVTFTQLKPGKYNFEVLGSNNDGVWALKTRQVDIIVAFPWYETWTAFIAYFISLMIAISLYVRTKQTRLKKINLQLEHTVSQRTKQLAEALDDKQKMFENLSHEFRTPLTLILGPIEKLLKQGVSASTDFDGINKTLINIKDQGDKLLYLVEQLLALAEVHAHNHNRTNCEIKKLTQTIVEGLTILAEENSVKIQLNNLTETLPIELIENAWETILCNLITNAIKHSPKNSTIFVEVVSEDNQLILTVADHGKGIELTEQDKIFQRFYKSPNHQKQGSGIGLALTKELVESLQGNIRLRSENNKGCDFIVSIPFERADVSIKHDSPSNVANPTVNRETEKKNMATVLLVEDEPELREYTCSVLEENFKILTANNGKEALELLQKQLPELIVSDVMMPEIDGFEFAEQVKQNEEYQHIPLILLTAKSDIQSQKQGYRAKVDDYIGKPFSSEILLLKASNLVESFNAHRNFIKKQFYAKEFNVEKIDSRDQHFMKKFDAALNEGFKDSQLKIEQLSQKINMDKRALARYTARLLNQTPGQALREYRLIRAMEMLRNGYTVTQCCFDCGFSSVAYFGSCFKQQFGRTPSSVLEG